MMRNIVNVSIAEWMDRCPEGSVAGSTGSANTYAVVIEQHPVAIITTKKDQRRVSKKVIIIGDDSGNKAELSIWGTFATRSWMYVWIDA
jgi:ssDNA-binding replication factor A large subunit